MAENCVIACNDNAKPLLATLAVVGVFFCATANAEEIENLSVTEALRLCAAFEEKDEKLACFEALASTVAPSSQSADAEAATDGSETSETVPDAPSAAATAASSATPEENATRPLAEDESLTFVRTTKSERERKRAEKERKKRKKHTLTVYRAWRNGVGELRIAFTNGEIWRQSGKGTSYDPQSGEEVVMKPGLMGGWTVSMKGGSRGARMRKVN